MPSETDFPLVSVVIVNYNGKAVLPRCLTCLEKQTFGNFEIIVVDNGSADGSGNLENSGRLRILKLGKNTGFAHACNRGAEIARGKWLAMLNSDAFAEPNWLEQLVLATARYPKCSFFASHQILWHSPELLDGTGDMFAVNGRAWRRDRRRPVSEGTDADDEVFGACAAAALYRTDCFLRAEGFDEDYFCYYEDVDISLRLRLAGQSCMHISSAKVHHMGSATSGGEESDFFLYHVCRNLAWTYLKSMPGELLRKHIMSHLRLQYDIALHFVRNRRRRLLAKIWLGVCREIPSILAKRRKIQRMKTISPDKLESMMIKAEKI